jgi:YD repeat-containing protein
MKIAPMKPYKLLLFIFFVVANLFPLAGQDNNADFKMPTIVPASPESKGLGKFGDVPVGTYTGTPDISIPIYTVKAGKLSLPITLSYHSTGVEVAQEATWVGLGWNLIAGGTISYIQVGGDDRSDNHINPDEFQDLIRFLGSNSSSPSVRNEDGVVGFSCTNPLSDALWVKTYMLPPLLGGCAQRDVYSANFAQYSFKFIKNPLYGIAASNQYNFLPYNKYVFMGQKNKCKIEDFTINYIDNGINSTDNGFVITGEDGTIFRFEIFEINHTTKALSWVLTKMISPMGDTISLKYRKVQMISLPSLNEQCTLRGDNLLPTTKRTSGGITERFVPYLDTIETKNELIVFESDSTRNDIINGGRRLNKITIKDKINQVEKFSQRFVYSYFTGNTIGGDYLVEERFYVSNPTLNANIAKNRLKLDSLIQCSNNLTNDKYAFSYYDLKPLPYKTSCAMDHWGYYNGQENQSSIIQGKSHTIIPNALPLILGYPLNYGGIDNRFYALQGAIRGASKDSSVYTAGMLKSIQYPTKGKTVFTYEPHDYYNYNYVSAEDEANLNSPTSSIIPKSAGVRAWGATPYPVPSVTQDTFTLTTRSSVTFSGYIDLTDGTVSLLNQNTNTNIIHHSSTQQDSNGHYAEWTEYLWLDPGTYTLWCTTPPQYVNSSDMSPEIVGGVTYDYDNQASSGDTSVSCSNCSHIGGGLRIKNIVNYDENNHVVSSKKYSYITENGGSSGQLLIPLLNINKKTIVHRQCPNGPLDTYMIPVCTLYGSSYISLSGYLSGNNVGYNRVVVESYNSSGSTNGKEISYYDNTPGSLWFFKIPFFPSTYNGNLVRKIILNANGDTLLTEKNNYSLLSGTNYSYTLNVIAEDTYEGPLDICPLIPGGQGNCCTSYENRLNIYGYPTQNYYNALFNKETTHYFPNGKVKETTSYNYNPGNYCVQSTTESTSKGVKYTNIKYPVDYSDNIHTGMVSKNQINTPVEKVDSVNVNVKFKVTTKDTLWNSSFYAPKRISSTKGSNAQDERIVFDNYDNYGNIIEAHQSNNTKESYVYGYNNCFPIIKGVSIDNVALNSSVQQALTASGYAKMDDLLKAVKVLPSTAWNTFNSTLRTLCAGSLITTYTYDPVFGMTSSTDPNGVTTYYVYDAFGRLKLVKDKDGKILKTYDYHYKQ